MTPVILSVSIIAADVTAVSWAPIMLKMSIKEIDVASTTSGPTPETTPATSRLYVHLLAWPMGELVLPGYAGKVRYAQLLHDASELRTSTRRSTTWISEEAAAGDLVVRLPILKPDVEIPVVELFLK